MADQLTSDELRQVLADWISPYPPKQRRKIAGLFEAVIARAETAEAEAARLRDENAEAWFAFDRQQSRGDRLVTRVAELESQAAQGMRDDDDNQTNS